MLVVIAILALLLGLIVAAVQNVRSAAARLSCQNNLKQISLSLQHYHDCYKSFPSAVRTKDDPFLHMTWLTRILPYIEQQQLWDSAVEEFRIHPFFWKPIGTHQATAGVSVQLFNCPSGNKASGTVKYVQIHNEEFRWGFTWYLGLSGHYETDDRGVLFANANVKIADILDGTSQTAAVGERPPSPDNHWGWWYAGLGQDGTGSADSYLAARPYISTRYRFPACDPGPYNFRSGTLTNECDLFHFWSLHPGGANFAFADGSVRFLRYTADSILPALSTRAGGEVAALD